MKTCGIITAWKMPDNYGSMLQGYAVQEVCKRHGIDATLIRTSLKRDESFLRKLKRVLHENGFAITAKKTIKIFSAKIYEKYYSRINQKRDFDGFCEKHKKQTERIFSSIKDLEENLPPMDLYIVGSDQVWNMGTEKATDFMKGEHLRNIFLDFAPKNAKRIACAVSFGTKHYNPHYKEAARPLIRKFDFISVREKSGVEICRELGYDRAVFNIDPTLLLSRENYKSLFCGREKIPAKKYVLLYLLNNPSDFSVGKFYAWARKKGLAVVYVNGNLVTPKIDFHKKVYATIPQWLSLVANAEYVFTNSFHGSCFSILFNRQFSLIQQKGKFLTQNERLENILEVFGIADRKMENAADFDRVLSPINWEKVNAELSRQREESPFENWLKDFAENQDVPRIPTGGGTARADFPAHVSFPARVRAAGTERDFREREAA